MENKRNGCINRDKNGCKNIQKVFYYIEYNERPERYKRRVDLQKLQTTIVPSKYS
jgi:sensor histidine kinase YesM